MPMSRSSQPTAAHARPALLAGGLLFGLLAASCPVMAETQERYELRAAVRDGSTEIFSIYDRVSGTAAWLRAGQRFDDLLVLGSEGRWPQCAVEHEGQRRALDLATGKILARDGLALSARSEWSPSPPPSGPTLATAAGARARAARSLHLPAPPSGPLGTPDTEPGARAPREGGARTETPSDQPATAETPVPADAPAGPAPMPGRRVNWVNSRLYASDHMKKTGVNSEQIAARHRESLSAR